MKKPLLIVVVILFTVSTRAFAWEWWYGTDTDEMTGKESTRALLRSTNSLELDFPYHGENIGFTTIRQHVRYGLQVYVEVQKGQILCRLHWGCTVMIRFDEGKPLAFTAVGPSDYSTDVLFIQNANRFVQAARKAKRIRISLEFFQNGFQVLQFDTDEPLKWPPPKKHIR